MITRPCPPTPSAIARSGARVGVLRRALSGPFPAACLAVAVAAIAVCSAAPSRPATSPPVAPRPVAPAASPPTASPPVTPAASPPAAVAATLAVADAGTPDAALLASPRYAAVFDELVAKIERFHAFPPAYAREVGHAWRDDLPRLRDEFVRAETRDQALVALDHLQNSLRDAHCYADPPPDTSRGTLSLGVGLWAGGAAAAPDVRIARIDRDLDPPPSASDLAVGDPVTAVDGTPIAAWIAAHPFETAALGARAALRDTVAAIATVHLPWVGVRRGSTRVLTVTHAGAPHDVTLTFRPWSPRDAAGPSLDSPPPMAQVDCVPGMAPDYGDYALADVGVNLCVYLPRRAARPRIAIVRYLSFYYQGPGTPYPGQELRMVKVDHDLLARRLRDVDGVVLDLHENFGGNNPFLFLGWFSGGPWDHPRVLVEVKPERDDATLRAFLQGGDGEGYAAARAARRAAYVKPFLCEREPCTAVTPPASERVTRASVAVVTGPSCMSSCDQFSLTWAAFHLGPIVGKQPMHAYTVIRLPIDVVGPDRESLGTLRVALSRSELRDGAPIEGEPFQLDWEAPDRFETRTSWVRAAVAEAARRLARR